jgi:hypothetical protein
LNDAVMTTNADTFIVERIVEIIEESWSSVPSAKSLECQQSKA